MMKTKAVAKENYVTTANLLKFILGSAFGVFMFLIPIPYGDSFTTMLDFVKNFIKAGFGKVLYEVQHSSEGITVGNGNKEHIYAKGRT